MRRRLQALFRKELHALFASPIAYAVLTAYVSLTSIYFFQHLLSYNRLLFVFQGEGIGAQSFDRGTVPLQVNSLEELFIPAANDFSLFLLAVLPLVTMRVFAEERANGTDELLLTTPLRAWEIALAKHGATYFFVALMLAVSALYPTIVVGHQQVARDARLQQGDTQVQASLADGDLRGQVVHRQQHQVGADKQVQGQVLERGLVGNHLAAGGNGLHGRGGVLRLRPPHGVGWDRVGRHRLCLQLPAVDDVQAADPHPPEVVEGRQAHAAGADHVDPGGRQPARPTAGAPVTAKVLRQPAHSSGSHSKPIRKSMSCLHLGQAPASRAHSKRCSGGHRSSSQCSHVPQPPQA